MSAGDSDFVPAIQVARDAGVVAELQYHAKTRVHSELLAACDERREITPELIQAIRV